jgi:FtsZ-binding cell division protein ZapB
MRSYAELKSKHDELKDQWSELYATKLVLSTEKYHAEEMDVLNERIKCLLDQMDLIKWFWGGEIK